MITCRHEGLCCANPERDSSGESYMIAGGHKQAHTPKLCDVSLTVIGLCAPENGSTPWMFVRVILPTEHNFGGP